MGGIILSAIAWVYLHIRYKSNEKISKILKEDYANSYRNAGSVYMLHSFAFISILCMLTGLVFGLVSFLFRG